MFVKLYKIFDFLIADSKIKPQSAPIKPTDLEKWLDTVLND